MYYREYQGQAGGGREMNWKRLGKAMLIGLASMAIGAIGFAICEISPYILIAIIVALIVGVAYVELGEDEEQK